MFTVFGGLLSSDLCIVVVLWHGLILACVLASVYVLVSDLWLYIVLLVVLLVLVTVLFLFVFILIRNGYSDESYICVYVCIYIYET